MANTPTSSAAADDGNHSTKAPSPTEPRWDGEAPGAQAPTPPELRELAARALALAADIDSANVRLRAAEDEPTQRVGFRLDIAAGDLRSAAYEVLSTATDLTRVIDRSDCDADWGVCPDHGATLVSSGGRSWCNTVECGRKWDYDRGGLPCDEPAAFAVAGPGGGDSSRLCAGHTASLRQGIRSEDDRLWTFTAVPTTPSAPATADTEMDSRARLSAYAKPSNAIPERLDRPPGLSRPGAPERGR
jgi:hypothetical protein